MYHEAVQRFYSCALTRTYLPSTPRRPRNARLQVLPTPPQTIHRAGPSCRLEQPVSLVKDDATGSVSESDGSSTNLKLPPFILHNIDAEPHVGPFYQLDPDSSDEVISEDPRIEADMIVIEADSDQELSQVNVPFLVVFWTMVRLYS